MVRVFLLLLLLLLVLVVGVTMKAPPPMVLLVLEVLVSVGGGGRRRGCCGGGGRRERGAWTFVRAVVIGIGRWEARGHGICCLRRMFRGRKQTTHGGVVSPPVQRVCIRSTTGSESVQGMSV